MSRPKKRLTSRATSTRALSWMSVRRPLRCSAWTRSSVQVLPPATFVNGQPPRPATDDSKYFTPARSAA